MTTVAFKSPSKSGEVNPSQLKGEGSCVCGRHVICPLPVGDDVPAVQALKLPLRPGQQEQLCVWGGAKMTLHNQLKCSSGF